MNLSTKKALAALMFVCIGIQTINAETSVCCSSTSECCSGCTQSQNLWQPHAFSVSMSREILLEKPAWTTSDDIEGWHGTFGVGFEYMQSLNSGCGQKSCCSSLGTMPFWAANQGNQMTVGDNSGDFDLDAYQMGLGPVTTNGTVRISPKVYQAGGDFFLYTGAHMSQRGFFVKIHGPVGVININPRISQGGDLEAVEYPYPDLAENTPQAAIVNPYENIIQAFAGGESAGDLRSLKYGRINCRCTSVVKFGDLAVSVGYNFYADETKHLGAAVRFTAPTGNKADAIQMLEPIFGRNGHWAAGGEIIGHWRVWQADEDDKYLDIWFDGTVEHLFESKHIRSFDLKNNGLGSKYLLLANYANNTYQKEITNAINVTTLPVQSTFSAEGNFALFLDYHHCNWNFGFGYEGWGRTCEQLAVNCGCPNVINLSNYAVLGRQTVNQEGPGSQLCDPTATISKSLDAGSTDALSATDVANRLPEDLWKAINIDGQRAHATYTSKAFGQLGYTYKDSDYTPYLALSGGAEFSNLKNSAVSYWSIGLQGGLAF